MKKEEIQQAINDTLNSIDQIQKASPQAYLLTRINARLNREGASKWELAARWISRPSIGLAVLGLVLLFNVVLISRNQPATKAGGTYAIQSVDEYSSSFASFANYETQEP